MAKKSALSSKIIPCPTNDMGVADNNLFAITNHKLNGHNYLQWSQSMMMFIYGKGKDNYFTRVASQLKKEDPKF